MKTTLARYDNLAPPPTAGIRLFVGERSGVGEAWATGGAVLGGWVALAWFTQDSPGWLAMWVLAGAEFALLKLMTLRGLWARAGVGRIAGYLLLWPGMNAAAFLRGRDEAVARPGRRELAAALTKLVLGLALIAWALRHAYDSRMMLVAWVGMLGIIFSLHFGLFHVVSWCWRAKAFDAPPLMRAPLGATSLTELWGGRWNVAFAESARRFVVRPVARRCGVRVAGLAVFALSGIIHETVISLPARGGWGGPTLYFLLQAAGIVVEKSARGIRAGLGRGVRGWIWTFFVAVSPLAFLFHGPFARNVIVPLYRSLAAFLP